MDCEPPFEEAYKTLLKNPYGDSEVDYSVEECELPLINLSRLSCGQRERDKCINEMVNAARNLGFFQVVSHGISKEILKNMIYEQKNLFHQPFQKKVKDGFLNLSTNSYRWGNLKATRLSQFSWSEAFHIAITDIPGIKDDTLRVTTEKITKAVAGLAKSLAEILAQYVGVRSSYFQENCPATGSYLRLNRYPPCPYSSKAMSNCVYRSSKHRAVSSQGSERLSVAYFYCPSDDAIIRGCSRPPVYRDFSFKEYKQQTKKDVEETGDKVGLSRFLL
ncbi:hypothetical protein FEM48_Zijuj01G0223300 [Ziziphus jujuba var. spinosa]|uniref:Non-haem dioxygenase N-terminal domain-containing protein n=1 Tax=Ziziphus jujuba var. spinosa TaxID=714518 RepID=A0A978W3W0_ZIZJJ|nr:hypothetical protein FEM48_Zijuj01G0223300 [Ziziphus jujuba var. spinosa]